MLVRLSIRDIVLIDALDLDVGRGLNVLTGETGAGKSILLDAFSLALGARGDAGLVRSDCAQGQVTAAFDVAMDHPARALLTENGLDASEDVILRRVQTADGRTRAFLNDQPVSAQVLRSVGRTLVELHGQHDERALVDADTHRALLDLFAGHDDLLSATQTTWRAWREAARLLASEEAALEKAMADADYLRHAAEELRALAPDPGEEDDLAGRRQAMMQAEKIASDLQDVLEGVAGSQSPVPQIASLARRLERRLEEMPDLVQPLVSALDRALNALGDAQSATEAAIDATAFDPRELERVEERLFALRGAARKYQAQVEDLPTLAQRFAEDVAGLDLGQSRIEAHRADMEAAFAAYRDAATALSASRHKTAVVLDAAVNGELPALKLEQAQFMTRLDVSEPEGGAADGIDQIVFWVQTNPGTQPGPLMKIASGGELSRFLLALKVSLAGKGGAPTLVFDEIDTGVSGGVSEAIGDRLARLGSQVQVLAVTHAPQVAAKASAHFLIEKSMVNGGERTVTRVAELAPEARREEVARMLAGQVITEEARAAADRLMASRTGSA
ncbi:MAG: DNA repair protein RecN [Pseudomonadota bacterium]